MVTISALKDIVLKQKTNKQTNNNNSSDLTGLSVMKGTGGKVGNPRTLFLDPPLLCTVSYKIINYKKILFFSNLLTFEFQTFL